MNIQNDNQPLPFGAQKLGTTTIEGLDVSLSSLAYEQFINTTPKAA